MICISKQLTSQRYIFKIRTERLKRAGWNLTLTLEEARKNEEIISLADSQVLRWIDELNGITDAEERALDLKRRIRHLRKQEATPDTKREMRRLYAELDRVQFKPDYMSLIIDKPKDYRRACKGFTINGVRYRRLLGTNGGIKNSTIVFVSERLWPELSRRIENGRMEDVPLVTAKLEAYKALTCSASIPVSWPDGILVVPDAKTEFLADYIYLTDENDGEPTATLMRGQKYELDASDGFGLMLPSLAERWSAELGLGYVAGGYNTRCSWSKGMLFAFDFIEFAERVAGTYTVRDAWGTDRDIRNVEAILTTSMLKLWDCYPSCEDYIEKSKANGYTFGVTKTAPEELENERTSNYQFLQPIKFDDADIEELIKPTMDEFHAVLHGDWRSTVLFMKGSHLDERAVREMDDDFIKAIMVNPRVLDDPFVQTSVYQQIRNRINQAKIGVLKLHANYSILSGDPYLLCQSIFGLEKTGLLGAGEIYNQYWVDSGAKELACFRAPMSTQENIRRVRVNGSEECRHWFQYIKTCTILNAWDTTTAALNGCDFDGDLAFLTDNPVILRRLEDLPALVCAQRKAEKKISADDDFIQSNIDSFGNEIGQTTNYVTSMYEVRAGFTEDSEEYRILSYRIESGQTYQQNAIDKAKGIVAKPMPREWHDRFASAKIEDPAQRELYIRIAADRKPYFMRYIYPDLMREYNLYNRRADKNALREFGMTVGELVALPEPERSEAQNTFLYYYYDRVPVGMNDCVMNKICRRFEEEFDGFAGKASAASVFDPAVLKSNEEYTPTQMRAVRDLYREFCDSVSRYRAEAETARIDKDECENAYRAYMSALIASCRVACSNSKALCNLIIDLCYKGSATKSFVWQICGQDIFDNLLEASGGIIRFPVRAEDGDYTYCGEKFRIEDIQYTEEDDADDDCAE